MKTIYQLQEERDKLSERIRFMNVESTGKDKLLQRKKEIDAEIERVKQTAS